MKVSETNIVTLSLSKKEIKEAIVHWLSRSNTRSNVQTCTLACYLNNDEPKIKFTKNCLTLEFTAETKDEEI